MATSLPPDDASSLQPQRERRLRTLTEAGYLAYNTKVSDFHLQLLEITNTCDQYIDSLQIGSNQEIDISTARNNIKECYKDYKAMSTDFIAYLETIHTKESEQHLSTHNEQSAKFYAIVDSAFKLNTKDFDTTRSRHSSHRSCRSSCGSVSRSLLAKQRAKAEAAMTSLSYAKRVSELEKQQAELEEEEMKAKAVLERKSKILQSDLTLLNKQKEADVAKAELEALYVESGSSSGSSRTSPDSLISAERIKRTRDYVNQQNSSFHCEKQASQDYFEQPKSCFNQQNAHFKESPHYVYHVNPPIIEEDNTNTQNPSSNQLAANPQINPQINQQYSQTLNSQSQLPDLAKFLLKKDLLLTRLTSFNERPESYLAWKTSFKSVMNDLGVTAFEEIDMLVKWLGPESSKYANSLRSANVRNPANGLIRIWERLNERYGSPQMVETALKAKLASLPKISYKDNHKFYELSDVLSEIQSAKEDDNYSALLSYFDTSSGVIPIVSKLPIPVQNKWTSTAKKYMKDYHVAFPPFAVFTEFIRDISCTMNDPSFNYSQENTTHSSRNPRHAPISVKKTDFSEDSMPSINKTKNETELCPLHHTKHPLDKCAAFKGKTLSDRKRFLHEHKICFRCCGSHSHYFRSCNIPVKCDDCGSDSHPTPLHVDVHGPTENSNTSSPMKTHGGEEDKKEAVTSKCTQVCGKNFNGRSCAKITLAKIYNVNRPDKFIHGYIVHDDQSNQTLGKSQFFDFMNIPQNESQSYELSSCSGTQTMTGRIASGFIIESLDGTTQMQLPAVIECNDIPDNREEIPTPNVARHHPHLSDIADKIPKLEVETPVLLLIGRDLPEAHHVLQQQTGPRNTPFAQKLNLGWVIVGEVCLGKQHLPTTVHVNKTYILNDGRTSTLPPCPNNYEVKELSYLKYDTDNIANSVFQRTKDDEILGPSREDKTFIELMDREFVKNSDGYWTAPLPFRDPRPRLPNNRPQAVKRSKSLDYSLKKDHLKREHFVNFMKDIFDNGHAEIAPPLQRDEECWYLPIFGVYHPHKPHQIRAVFDSSAKHEGHSLNSVLLSGPNLTNELLGVLMRFRKETIAIIADLRQMFYSFYVKPEHRNFLRFLWYRNNDLDQPLIEYRMRVHVFGNSPSPAVATYGLRKIVENTDPDVVEFVKEDFYVDDGLTSFSSQEQAIDVLKRTQRILLDNGNLRLHKIASNSEEVLSAFPTSDLARDLKDLDLRNDIPPIQRSLGLYWDISSDVFTYRLSNFNKPLTRRGLLSVVNSLFDPIGFISPVVIKGKILLRDLVSGTTDWDEPIPTDKLSDWTQWVSSLKHLENFNIQRTYGSTSYSETVTREVIIYCDASEKAIAAVAYLKTADLRGQIHIGFVFGKTKVAPQHGHTIPRLELCSAVMAVEIAEIISHQLDIPAQQFKFRSDSRVVLGYIYNQTRRFYIYVSNRVDRIRKFSKPEQWSYIATDNNPADQGTRCIPAQDLQESSWLTGPKNLRTPDLTATDLEFTLIDPEEDTEIRPVISVNKTSVTFQLGSQRFTKFSTWTCLVRAISHLKHIAQCFKISTATCKNWHSCDLYKSVQLFQESELLIIKTVQQELYSEEIRCIKGEKPLHRNSLIISLCPVLDENGLLRVGGRLNKSTLPLVEKNPIIISGKHYISTLLIRHYHESVHHQGRHFTEGALRANGFWITGAKRLINSILHECVKCRRLRGDVTQQIMSDLPSDRLQPCPPFTCVGLDVFGPWQIVTRRTRGGLANSKRWALLFTCLVSRCVHIEVIEEISTPSCINAIRRFIALRGPVKEFRSDRGTNFIGSTKPLQIDAVNVEDGPMKDFLYNSGVTWKFNSPHTSHAGGVWERMIGISRRILDSMLLDNKYKNLTHEVLSTFMAEVCIIINSRPITAVSTDPESPTILTPSVLLTQKTSPSTIKNVENLDIREMYKSQWKYVQVLAEQFWLRFRREYLPTLQNRRKWCNKLTNLKVNDFVLLKDKNIQRTDWNTGLITKVFPSQDNLVRKAEVKVIRDGKPCYYTRPITEIVQLLSDTNV